jgi:UV DNA damage endonuclease
MLSKYRIGYACTPISIPYKTSRSFILKNFREDIFRECVSSNIKDLMNILQWNVKNKIFMFRISSDIIPFGSHPVNNLKWWEMFKEELAECGNYIKDNGMRVSLHPGQYTVLNSQSEDTVQRSLADLEYHCRFLDALGVDYTNKLILHVGGVYGDKVSAMENFKVNFQRLSESAQKRLVVENDDKSYTIEEVLSICNELNIPAVFDNLHHKLNPCDIGWDEILRLVKATWKIEDGPVKFHYSDQDEDKRGGAHSKSVVTRNFLSYMDSIKALEADIMLEVKDKEISAVKCVCALEEDLSISTRTEQWAKYKYAVMEKNYSYYKKCSSMVNSELSMREVYEYIDDCLSKPFNEGSFRNAAEHVYGYVKDKATAKEKDNFNELIKNTSENRVKIKDLLRKLCKKYNAEYINNSYYFIY